MIYVDALKDITRVGIIVLPVLQIVKVVLINIDVSNVKITISIKTKLMDNVYAMFGLF